MRGRMRAGEGSALSKEALHLVSLLLATAARRHALLMSCGRFVRFLPALAVVVAFGRLRLGQLDGDATGKDGGHIVQALVAIVLLRLVVLLLHLAQFDTFVGGRRKQSRKLISNLREG